MRSRSSISWRIHSSHAATRSWPCPRSCDDYRNRSRRSSAISRTRNACSWGWIFVYANEGPVPLNPRPPRATFEPADRTPPAEPYILRLYVTGMTSRSARAVHNVRAICDEYLKGQYDLEVIDIYQQPALTKGEQIVAAPTLI